MLCARALPPINKIKPNKNKSLLLMSIIDLFFEGSFRPGTPQIYKMHGKQTPKNTFFKSAATAFIHEKS